MRRQPAPLIILDGEAGWRSWMDPRFPAEQRVKTNMTPLRGRSLRGERLLADVPFGKWRTQTFVAGLRSDALIAPGSSKAPWMARLSTPM